MKHKTGVDYELLSEAVASLKTLDYHKTEMRHMYSAIQRLTIDTITLYKSAGFSNLEIRAILFGGGRD